MNVKMSNVLPRNVALPAGWHWQDLEAVATVLAGNPAPQGEQFFAHGKHPFVRVYDMGQLGSIARLTKTRDYVTDEAASRLRSFPEGAVLFTKSGASTLLNQRAILGQESFVVSHIAVAIPTEKVSSEWIYYWLLTVDFNHIAHATTLPSLPLSKVKSISIPVAPVGEQRRIVAEIEKQFTRLEAGVAALKRVQAGLKRYRAAVLKAACEGRLVPTEAEIQRPGARGQKPARVFETGEALLARVLAERRRSLQGRCRYEEPAAPITTELPPLPESWTWVTVEQLLRNDSGLGYGILKPGKEDPNGVPMVRVMDIGDGKLADTEIVKVEAWLSEEFNRTVLESGDILLAVMATVGRCTVVPERLVGANVNRALAVIKPTSLVPSKFLELAIRSPRLQHLFQKNKIGSAQARINLSDLRTYCLPLPPLAEQTRIVAEVERRLSVIDELEGVVSANLRRAGRLRQAVLQRAFVGYRIP